MKRIRQVKQLTTAGPYSFATVEGNTAYITGQVGQKDSKIVEGGIEAETHQTMKNLGQILEALDCNFGDVLKATLYLTDVADFQTVNTVYGSYFSKDNYPVRETVGVAALPLGAKIEISLIAQVTNDKDKKLK